MEKERGVPSLEQLQKAVSERKEDEPCEVGKRIIDEYFTVPWEKRAASPEGKTVETWASEHMLRQNASNPERVACRGCWDYYHERLAELSSAT